MSQRVLESALRPFRSRKAIRERIVACLAGLLASWWLIVAGVPTARAQSRATTGTIDGVVTDTNLVSLANATASILGSEIKVVTGANGRFQILRLPVGQYVLIVRRIGYAPSSTALQVAGGDTLLVSFALERTGGVLDTVMVTSRRLTMKMAEFEARRKLGYGQFMTTAEIEQRNSVSTVDLLRTFTSVRVASGVAVSRRFPLGMKPCPLKVFVDGVALPTPNLDKDVPIPKVLAAIEVYSGPATIPLQYKTTDGGHCGVILLWTKDGS